MKNDSTICALATPEGKGALAIIRINGNKSIEITDKIFHSASNVPLHKTESNKACYGTIKDNEKIIDEVVVYVYKSPNSYTGEDLVEISCHCSGYIISSVLELLTRNGATIAKPGEYTMRAYLNGKLDLAQAEAVADLIASSSEASHKIAMQQMRGGYSEEIKKLRTKLVELCSLIELELDFSDEDVEFAKREDLKELCSNIEIVTKKLAESFRAGNAIKNGTPAAIIGKTNSGKSTLLNTLLNDDKAIISEKEGTTRDSIEDTTIINGFLIRFIDTAGLRNTTDSIEQMGIERTLKNISNAHIILFIIDPTQNNPLEQLDEISIRNDQKLIVVINKIDKAETKLVESIKKDLNELPVKYETVTISAKEKQNIDQLTNALCAHIKSLSGDNDSILITNARHHEAIAGANNAIKDVINGIDNGIATDLLAEELKSTINFLGQITGEITNTEVLDSIFRDFCIGK